jgi:hypothetical protein
MTQMKLMERLKNWQQNMPNVPINKLDPRRIPKNMGMVDRIARGLIGGVMMLSAITSPRQNLWSRITMFAGGAFMVYGLSGYDPLLSAAGTSTFSERQEAFGLPKLNWKRQREKVRDMVGV